MIKSNLAALLAERNLRISKVSECTGISRTTLTALATGKPQGIQLDTLDALCMYLGVTPNELLLYIPHSIKVSIEKVAGQRALYAFSVTHARITDVHYHVEHVREGKSVVALELSGMGADDFDAFFPSLDEQKRLEMKKQSERFVDLYESLPIQFRLEIDNDVIRATRDCFGLKEGADIRVVISKGNG